MRTPTAREVPGIVVYRWEAPLFFANAGAFRRQIRNLVRERSPRWVVVQCEAITDIDVTAAEMLEAARQGAERRRCAHGVRRDAHPPPGPRAALRPASRRSTAITSTRASRPRLPRSPRRSNEPQPCRRSRGRRRLAAVLALLGTAGLVAFVVVGPVRQRRQRGDRARRRRRRGRRRMVGDHRADRPAAAIGIAGVVVGLVVVAIASIARARWCRSDRATDRGLRLAARVDDGLRTRRNAARAPPARHARARRRFAEPSGPAVQPVVRRRKGRALRPASSSRPSSAWRP